MMWHRSVALLVILVALHAAAEAPSAPPAKAPAASRRPALLRKQQGVALATGQDDATDAPVVSAADEGATDEASALEEPEEPLGFKGLVEQFGIIAFALVVRFVISFAKSHLAKRAAAGQASPLAGVAGMIKASPLGGVLALVEQLHLKIADIVRSPTGGPIMIGLLIVATKLVARSDERRAQMYAAAGEELPTEGTPATEDDEPEASTIEDDDGGGDDEEDAEDEGDEEDDD